MTRAPRARVPRAPVSRPDTSATGRPERPDPCADPPTVTIDPTRVMPAALFVDPPFARDAAAVPRLRSVTPAGGGALGDGRVLPAASAVGALGSLACWLVAARTLPAAEAGRAVAVVALVAVAACAARPDRGAALVGRLPAAGRRAGRVAVGSLATAAALGAGAGAALASLVPGPAATLSGPPAGAGVPWTGVLLVAARAVGGVHDGVAVALDRPWWAFTHVVGLVATRVGLLLAAVAALGPEYPPAADVLRVLLLGAAIRLVVVHELAEREAAGRVWSSARLHLCTAVPALLAVGVVAAVVGAVLGGPVPTAAGAAPPGAARALLLPVAAVYVLVQVACAAAVLASRPARRRARREGQP